jgi:hypothetical protein
LLFDYRAALFIRKSGLLPRSSAAAGNNAMLTKIWFNTPELCSGEAHSSFVRREPKVRLRLGGKILKHAF